MLSIEKGTVREAHNLERATTTYSRHVVFTDQFIFRTVLARIKNIFKVPEIYLFVDLLI